jgi:hypothetical protein
LMWIVILNNVSLINGHPACLLQQLPIPDGAW